MFLYLCSSKPWERDSRTVEALDDVYAFMNTYRMTDCISLLGVLFFMRKLQRKVSRTGSMHAHLGMINDAADKHARLRHDTVATQKHENAACCWMRVALVTKKSCVCKK
jgi:hypothetical protein